MTLSYTSVSTRFQVLQTREAHPTVSPDIGSIQPLAGSSIYNVQFTVTCVPYPPIMAI